MKKWFLTKLGIYPPFDLAVLFLGIHPGEAKVYVHTEMLIGIFICYIQSGSNLVFVNWWLDKQIVIYLCSRILLYERNVFIHTPTQMNIHTPTQSEYLCWVKNELPDKKYVLYDSI